METLELELDAGTWGAVGKFVVLVVGEGHSGRGSELLGCWSSVGNGGKVVEELELELDDEVCGIIGRGNELLG